MNFSVNLRYLGYFKSYVQNKRQPEGSIAECYITEECPSYCSRYMESNVESKNNHDVEEESPRLFIFSVPSEYSAFQSQYRTFMHVEMHSAYNHCLFNCDEVTPYIEYVTLHKFQDFINLKSRELSQHVIHILQTTPGSH